MFPAHHEAEDRRDEEQRKHRREHEPAEHDAADTPVQFRSGARGQDQRQEAECRRQHAHHDGPDAGSHGFGDGFTGRHAARSPVFTGRPQVEPLRIHKVQGLVHDQNGIVDDNADQNDKPQHGQDVHGLMGNDEVDDGQPEKTTGRGQRHAEDNNKRIQETFKQGRHQQIGDEHGHEQIVFQGVIGFREIVRRACQVNIIETPEVSRLFDRTDNLLLDQVHGRLQRDLARRNDLDGDGPFPFDVVDLFGACNERDIGNITDRGEAAARGKYGQVPQVLRSIGILIDAPDGEIDLVSFKLIVTRLGSVHQGVNGKAECLIRHLHVCRPVSPQVDSHFGTSQVETRLRANLCARQDCLNLSEDPPAQGEELVEVRPGNFNVDVPPFAQPSLK